MTALAIYNPDDSDTYRNCRESDLQLLWRLRDAWEQLLRPRLQQSGAAAGTLAEYRVCLNRWERHSTDPPVHQLDDQQLADYFERAGFRSPATRAKHWRHLRAILRACTARGPGNPRGMPADPLLPVMPAADSPPVQAARTRHLPRDVLGSIYRASAVATWPDFPGVRPETAWRALWVLLGTYGLRTCELVHLRRESIWRQPECPDPRWAGITSPHGWLQFVPRKTRRHKPDPLLLPLTATARVHLDQMLAGPAPASGRLLDLPVSLRPLHHWRRTIQHAAGVAEPYTFRTLRSYAATAWNTLHAGLGQHVTGHAPRGVHATFYDQQLARLVAMAPQLPEPAEFTAGAARLRGPEQLRLF